MRRFYELVLCDSDLGLDPVEASRREVQWWRLHREHQYGVVGDEEPLVDSLVDLYSYVYGVPGETVWEAARQRVLAKAKHQLLPSRIRDAAATMTRWPKQPRSRRPTWPS